MYEYLLTKDNEKVYFEDVIRYMNVKKNIEKEIKSSQRFYFDAQNQDFTMYNKIMDDLKLRTPDGTKLSDYEVLNLYKYKKIGSEKKNSFYNNTQNNYEEDYKENLDDTIEIPKML